MSQHYTQFSSFSEAFIGFAQEARNRGFQSGIQCTKDTFESALFGLWPDKALFEYALTSLFCQEQEEREVFKKMYTQFWKQKGTVIRDKRTNKNQKSILTNNSSSAVMLGTGETEENEEGEEAKTTTGANTKETLKRTDFAYLTKHQSDLLDELSEKLVKEMSQRLKRRKKKSNKGQIDIANSIRLNIQNGGNILKLAKKNKKKDKYRLMVLLDVSGSMDKYSFYLLKFLWALRSNFKQIEVFTFSTKLMRITDYISDKNMGVALAMVSQHAKHWSSGTKIGGCLKDFNDNYAKRYLNGKTMTIVLSDGLDTGEPAILDTAMQQIKMRSKKLIWLNPLKGMQGYEPIQMGMKAALPSLNHFGSAHNFESLLTLEKLLQDA